MRRIPVVVALLALLGGALTAGSSATAAPTAEGGGGDGLEVYTGDVTPAQLRKLRAFGLDHEDSSTHAPTGSRTDGRVRVEAIITGRQAEKLRGDGVDLQVKQVKGRAASDEATRMARTGATVFRSYSAPGGIRDELTETAAANPALTKLVTIGRTVKGQEILALKLTKQAGSTTDGSRPAVLYAGAQHAREWITPEMVRRLMHYYLDGYGSDPRVTRLVDTTELWFVPVTNPDGYDFTFTEGNRFWRKNQRDVNGDGVITAGDGIDLNRNFATKWGYDNEGSSPDRFSETYRGAGPGSEPETRAVDQLVQRVGFEFYVNYHSPFQQLLYGIGWQVSTPSPDDVITKRWPATMPRPRSPATTRTSTRRCTPPTARPQPHRHRLRHRRLHAGDDELRDRLGVGPGRRVAPRATAPARSTSPTTRD